MDNGLQNTIVHFSLYILINYRMNENILSIKNLSIRFGSKENEKVADSVSFSLKSGKIMGIVGESGSGKSVTCLALLGLLDKKKATIDYDEMLWHEGENSTDIGRLSETEWRKWRGSKIGFVFQEHATALNPVFTCGNQIAEMFMVHQAKSPKEAKALAIEWLKKVKLTEPERIYDAYPHQISGGQKQRVMIAMAMCLKPQLLIADEPTTALDVGIQKSIVLLIKELQQEMGTSVIFITHDLVLANYLADDILVMYKGKVVEQGATKRIFETPKEAYTKGLLACRPQKNIRLAKLPTVNDFLQDKAVTPVVISQNDLLERRAFCEKQPILLDIKNISVRFVQQKNIFQKTIYKEAVKNVSLQIREGETIGLVGESGCGKTSLGRAILRLIPAYKGEIIFCNENILAQNRPENTWRTKMQIIFQDPYASLNPRYTIEQTLLEPLLVHKLYTHTATAKNQVQKLLDSVQLSKQFLGRYPHELSGGQRQRVCIARALALNPRFIVCDESIAALDVSVQAQILNLLQDLKSEFQFSSLFISHDLLAVQHIADRILVMNDGTVVEQGWADDVLNYPKSDYTQRLVL